MSAIGVGGTSIVLALVASLGGFGCLCNVASHRCGGDDDIPVLRDPDPGDFDGGSSDSDAADASDSGK